MSQNLTLSGVRSVIQGARSGAVICYHRGCLFLDRKDNPALAALADLYLRAGTEEGWGYSDQVLSPQGTGLGFLTQRKIGECNYEYLFTKK